MPTSENQIEIYQTSDGQTEIQVRLEADTVWLNRQQLAELFGRDIKTIGKHIGNVFKEGELSQNSAVANFATAAADGKSYQVEHYNLGVIISGGYRVKSQQGKQLRIWATRRLKEYLVHQQGLFHKAAQYPELTGPTGRELVDIVSRYTQTFFGCNAMMKACWKSPPAGQSGGQLPSPDRCHGRLATAQAAVADTRRSLPHVRPGAR